MCFSAPASFIASGALGAIGGASLKVAKKEDRLIALIPFIFGIQQAFEGMQWLYIKSGAVSYFAAYGFLFFAYIFWPVYVPICMYIIDTQKKKIMRWFVWVGTSVALFFLWKMFTGNLTVTELGSSISYNLDIPFRHYGALFYMIAVFGPFFASSRPTFRFLGLVFAFFAVVSALFFTLTFVSVWCFFAALVSSLFYVYIKRNNKG